MNVSALKRSNYDFDKKFADDIVSLLDKHIHHLENLKKDKHIDVKNKQYVTKRIGEIKRLKNSAML